MIWIGGLALVAATLLNVGAVIGRHVGRPLHGAIELVQVAVLVAGTLALVLATVTRRHARVRLILDRIPLAWRRAAERCCDLLAMLFFAALLAGSSWLAIDLWGAQEVSELLGVPWRWLRLFADLGFAALLLIALRQAIARHPA